MLLIKQNGYVYSYECSKKCWGNRCSFCMEVRSKILSPTDKSANCLFKLDYKRIRLQKNNKYLLNRDI